MVHSITIINNINTNTIIIIIMQMKLELVWYSYLLAFQVQKPLYGNFWLVTFGRES